MSKFKKGQAVYHVHLKRCMIICNDYIAGHECLNQFSEKYSYESKNLRALHETPGYYVPEEGDKRVEGYYHRLPNEGWREAKKRENKITAGDLRISEYRFPLPPEASESEKWARQQQLMEPYTKSVSATEDGDPCQVCGGSGIVSYNPHLNPSSFSGSTSAPCPHCKERHTVTSVSVGEGLTERPRAGEIILIYNINGVYAIRWNDDLSFGKNETGWEYQSELNAPYFPGRLLTLARKLKSCTEAEAVAMLKERGIN